MPRSLPASAFAEPIFWSESDLHLTPFGAPPAGLTWAKAILAQMNSTTRGIKIPFINLKGSPSTVTYLDWLRQALDESGESAYIRLTSRNYEDFLWVHLVDRKAGGKAKPPQVKHVIT